MMLRPGLVSVTFRQLKPEAIVPLAAECGLEAIEWGGDVHVPPGNRMRARDVRQMTWDAGLQVAAYGSYWRATDQGIGEVLETADDLEAPTVRVWAGSHGSTDTSPEERTRVVNALRDACNRAKPTISLEYHAGTLTDSLESTLRLVDEVDHPNLRLYWQPVPERPLETLLAEVDAVRPHLSNVHVFQWARPQQETIRHPLSDGEATWPVLLGHVANVPRFALLEFVPGDDPSLLPAEAATLRRWLSAEP